MHSRVRIVAEKGRLPRIEADGAIAVRITSADTVHLVGAAATPLGGDLIEVAVSVGPGARLIVRSAAASVALPGRHVRESASRWMYDVGPDALLDVDPEPIIVAGDAVHHVATEVRLSASATVRVRERIQIGRQGEDAGSIGTHLVVDVDGRPLLRHALELGAAGDDLRTGHRALDSEFRYPDARPAEVVGLVATRLPLAGGGSLTTRQSPRLTPGAPVGS